MLIKPENCDKYKYLVFDFLVVELQMQWIDVERRTLLPRMLHTFILNPLN